MRVGALFGLLVVVLAATAGAESVQIFWEKDPRSDPIFPIGARPWGIENYIDTTGAVVLDRKRGVSFERDFFEGLAGAKGDNGFGYIDTDGEWVVAPEYSDGRDFSEGLAAVQLNSKWGYVDRAGTLVIEARFDEGGEFHDGRAAVRLNDRYGFIDTSGKLLSMNAAGLAAFRIAPERAIGADQGGRYLLTVNKENVVEKRTIRMGQLVDGLRVIEEGLQPGDRVVVNGLQRARPGAKVDLEDTDMKSLTVSALRAMAKN